MKTISDRFGQLNLEDDVLYGAQTARTLANMTCSRFKMSDFPVFITALARVKEAAALANHKAGVLSKPCADAITAACKEIIEGKHHEQFPVDMLHGGGSIGFNQNMNEVLATLASRIASAEQTDKSGTAPVLSAKNDINAGQSTADACATAFRLALLDELERLQTELAACSDLLLQLAADTKELTTVARTCLQDALPVQISSYFSAWAAPLRRTISRLQENAADLSALNLGGTVIGNGAGADPVYRQHVIPFLSEICGKDFRLKENLYDAAQNIDELISLSANLEILAITLLKISQDLRLLSSGPNCGFGELKLPAVQEGSSFFQAKNNPVLPETMMQASFHVIGNHRAASAAYEHAELNLNVFESGAFFHILGSIELLSQTIRLFRENCLAGLSVNKERLRQLLEAHLSK